MTKTITLSMCLLLFYIIINYVIACVKSCNGVVLYKIVLYMFLLSPAPVVFSNISIVFLSNLKEILPRFTLQFPKWIFYALPLQNEDQDVLYLFIYSVT